MVSISTVALIVPRSRPEPVLGEGEDVAPQRRLVPALELGQIEIGARALGQRRPRIVPEVEGEIEQAPATARRDRDMVFRQMPAARADHQHRRIVADRIALAAVRIGVSRACRASSRADSTWPWTSSSQAGEVASSKSAMNAWAPLLSALIIILALVGPVISTRRSRRSARDRRDRPFGFADLARVFGGNREARRRRTASGGRASRRAAPAGAVEALVQLGDEIERVGGQDVVRAR